MLFSNDMVATYINKTFEPAWEMVRAVPIVKIDFGNGNVITRTLHGNIASYVCNADGEVYDVLPGIYTADSYVQQLMQFRLLVAHVEKQGKANRAKTLLAYHELQAARLKKNEQAAHFVNLADLSKAKIENRIEALLVTESFDNPPVLPTPRETKVKGAPTAAAEELAGWKLLEEDTRLNESLRRRQIHEMLARADLVKPEQIKKPLYKDVLHADLDDPYLGLGKTLFGDYPFANEDKR